MSAGKNFCHRFRRDCISIYKITKNILNYLMILKLKQRAFISVQFGIA